MSVDHGHAKQLRLINSPQGLVTEDDVALVEVSLQALQPGEVLVAARLASVDPAIRVYMDATSIIGQNKVLFDRVGVHAGQPIQTWIAGEVVASRSNEFPIGSFVREIFGRAPLQDRCVLSEASLKRVDTNQAQLTAHLSSLGMPGITAYAGLVDVGQPRLNETVVVSAAAGGVGGLVGQIAKAIGCRVIGIAGGADKCAHVRDDLGFDACIDYKSEDLAAALDALCPTGIDIYFDNVGGAVVDICISKLANRGRVVICGVMSAYGGEPKPIYNYFNLLSRSARCEAFNYYDVVSDPRRSIRIQECLLTLVETGKLRHQVQLFEGLEGFVPALRAIYAGQTRGKTMISI